MSSCYVFKGIGSDGWAYAFDACCTNPGWIANTYRPGYYTPGDNGQPLIPHSSWWSSNGQIISCITQADVNAAHQGVAEARGSCSGCLQVIQPYDCINGQCVLKTQYNTPGYYNSLADCQAVCGTGGGSCGNGKICVDPNSYCPPGKVCLEQSEYGQITSLITDIKNQVC